uniref:K+ potassium transporter integral membrane domain-containing protein n=1 Tax=Zea mays TaxID=4577 RepID=A0A804MGW3_MAIZE
MSLEVDNPAGGAGGGGESANRLSLKRHDSLFGDAEKVSGGKYHGSEGSWARTLHLAFQSVGIIYGDIGTSPLYVYSSTFPDGIKYNDDLLGVLSLIIYTLIIIPMLKYVFVVLYANDNGDGGTFALYSLISRYAKIRLIPNQQAEDAMVSNYSIEAPTSQLKRAQWFKQKLESSRAAKILLFTLTILGTSMVMGDGTLTPSISVLSAVSGIKEKAPNLTQTQVVWISVAILFLLFSVQRFGTDKVGYTFAPVISVWFVLIAGIGLYNLVVHDVGVLRAFNPWYIVQYFKRNGKEGWVSLGGVILCVTGTEGMFADLGHFNIRAVQLQRHLVPIGGTVLHRPSGVPAEIPGERRRHLLQIHPSTSVLANLHHRNPCCHHRKPGDALWRVRHPLQGLVAGLSPQGASDPHLQEVRRAGVHPGGELHDGAGQHHRHHCLQDHHQHWQRIRDLRGDHVLHHHPPDDRGDARHMEEAHRLRPPLLRGVRPHGDDLPLVHPVQVHPGRLPPLLLRAGPHDADGDVALRPREAVLVRAGPHRAHQPDDGAAGEERRAADPRGGAPVHGAGPGHPARVPPTHQEDPVRALHLPLHVHQAPAHPARAARGEVPVPAGRAQRAAHLPLRRALRLQRRAGGAQGLRVLPGRQAQDVHPGGGRVRAERRGERRRGGDGPPGAAEAAQAVHGLCRAQRGGDPVEGEHALGPDHLPRQPDGGGGEAAHRPGGGARGGVPDGGGQRVGGAQLVRPQEDSGQLHLHVPEEEPDRGPQGAGHSQRPAAQGWHHV